MPAFTIPQLRWPIVISAGVNDTFDISEGGGAWTTVTIPSGTYFWRGDGSATDLAKVLELALEAVAVNIYTCTLSGAGLLTIYRSPGPALVDIDWSSGTIDAAIFGFAAAATGDANSHTGDFQVGRAWLPQTERIDDTRDIPRYSASTQRMADGSVDTQQWASHFERTILIDRLLPRKIFADEELAAQAQEAWQASPTLTDRPSVWWASGERFEFCPDFASRSNVLTNPGTYTTYKPREDHQVPGVQITAGTVDRYDVTLRVIYYVA